VSHGKILSQSCVLRAAKQPHDIPKKEAMRTTFVKNCRKMTEAANQRMHDSSRKSTRKPTRKRFTTCIFSLRGALAIAGLSNSKTTGPNMAELFLQTSPASATRLLERITFVRTGTSLVECASHACAINACSPAVGDTRAQRGCVQRKRERGSRTPKEGD